MEIDEFVHANRCQHLLHMAAPGSWPSIRRLGLLSTSALLDSCGVSGPERTRIERELRPTTVAIPHPETGTVFIRDQDPMMDRPARGLSLDAVLEGGVARSEWLRYLNGKVFFWIREDNFRRMIAANMYRNKPQWVLKVDTASLLRAHADSATVSLQNTGSLYGRRMRGLSTFAPFSSSPLRNDYVELAIDRGVPDIETHTFSVDECVGRFVNGEAVCEVVRNVWIRDD